MKVNTIAIVGAVLLVGVVGVGSYAIAQQADDQAETVGSEQVGTGRNAGVEQDARYFGGHGYYGRGWGWGYGSPFYGPRYYYGPRRWYYTW